MSLNSLYPWIYINRILMTQISLRRLRGSREIRKGNHLNATNQPKYKSSRVKSFLLGTYHCTRPILIVNFCEQKEPVFVTLSLSSLQSHLRCRNTSVFVRSLRYKSTKQFFFTTQTFNYWPIFPGYMRFWRRSLASASGLFAVFSDNTFVFVHFFPSSHQNF